MSPGGVRARGTNGAICRCYSAHFEREITKIFYTALTSLPLRRTIAFFYGGRSSFPRREGLMLRGTRLPRRGDLPLASTTPDYAALIWC